MFEVRFSNKLLMVSLGLLVTGLFAPRAKADNLDFSCGSGSCTGTVVASGGNYSSTGTGIGVVANFEGDPFSLTFNTATGAIALTEIGDPTGGFSGTITSWTLSSGSGLTDINATATWNVLPSDVSGNVGSTPFSFIVSFSSTGLADSVDVPITTSSVPEPASLLLLGAGLVSLGLLLKFKAPATV